MDEGTINILIAIVNMQSVLFAGTNAYRERRGECPAYTDDSFTKEYYLLETAINSLTNPPTEAKE